MNFRQRFASGALCVGTMVSEVRNPNMGYLMAQAGFDFIVIDMEHGAHTWESLEGLIAGCRGAGIGSIVRIPEIRRETVLKPLDSGADGLLVPQVDTAAQATEIIRHAKYPPMGRRGAALKRAHSFYQSVVPSEYMRHANDSTVVMIQVETRASLENLEEILGVPGIDGAFVGPSDLSVDFGVPDDLSHPSVLEATDRVFEACGRLGRVAGIHMTDREKLRQRIEQGARFVTYSGDIPMLADAAKDALSYLKHNL